MKTNVGQRVQDTSADTASIIGKFLNRRMYQVLRAINWKYINEDYTISVTSAAQDYALASDFGKEVACVDTTNGIELANIDFGKLLSSFPDSFSSSGNVERYSVFVNDSGEKKVRFHYYPSASITVAMPYIVKPTEMSLDADTPVIDISDLIEIGAEADAWRYKRQFQKASVLEAMFEKNLADYIWEQANEPNQIVQFTPDPFDRDNLY